MQSSSLVNGGDARLDGADLRDEGLNPLGRTHIAREVLPARIGVRWHLPILPVDRLIRGIAVQVRQRRLPAAVVPSLFRQTLISSGKRREPTSGEVADQTAYPQVQESPSKVRAVLRRLTAIAEARREALNLTAGFRVARSIALGQGPSTRAVTAPTIPSAVRP
jgi:hypothetical protein